MSGTKHDHDKLRYDLIDPKFLEDLAAVLTMGAKKYDANNWQQVDDARNRYIAALYRHLEADRMGEHNDEESGLLHLAHVACNAMFLHYLRRKHGNTDIQRHEDRDTAMFRELRSIIEHCMLNDNEETSYSGRYVREAYLVLDRLRSYFGVGALGCHNQSDGSIQIIFGTGYPASYYVSNVSQSTLSRLQRLSDSYISESK